MLKQNERPIIMVIDDDPVILNSLISVLKKEYDVRPFISGAAALQFFKPVSKMVDLIILDYQMPDMTGLEVLQALQSNVHTHEIPVIFLTCSINSENEAEALELGAVDYITKPICSRLLLTRIRLQVELLKHRKQLEALVEEKTRSLNDTYIKLKLREEVTLNMLAKATDMRDHETGDHIKRTTEFVRIIVEDVLDDPQPGYRLSRAEADDIIRSSKLHDLGKIAMPDQVLLKPGFLTEEEFNIVKKHTIDGEQFLREFADKMNDSFLKTARDIAYAHHEKWDGNGYPRGLKGEEIPLSARIVAIADVYDALISVRPYKGRLSHEDSLEIMVKNSGTHFDPYLIQIFRRHAQEFWSIAEQNGVLKGSETAK